MGCLGGDGGGQSSRRRPVLHREPVSRISCFEALRGLPSSVAISPPDTAAARAAAPARCESSGIGAGAARRARGLHAARTWRRSADSARPSARPRRARRCPSGASRTASSEISLALTSPAGECSSGVPRKSVRWSADVVSSSAGCGDACTHTPQLGPSTQRGRSRSSLQDRVLPATRSSSSNSSGEAHGLRAARLLPTRRDAHQRAARRGRSPARSPRARPRGSCA